MSLFTELKVLVFGVILVRIFQQYLENILPSISLYSVRMRENTDQNNSEYGHFSCSYYVQEKKAELGNNRI